MDTSVDLEHASRAFAVVVSSVVALQMALTVAVRRPRIAAVVTMLTILLVPSRASDC